jgi:hypothetical protein
MTKKDFFERSREIMAAKELTLLQKRETIRNAASFYVEKIWNRLPEVRDLMKRFAEAEKKHAGYNGFSYCPHDGEWSPRPPDAIKALDREWTGLREEKVREAYREILKVAEKAMVKKAA